MGLFARQPSKASLHDYKAVVIHGHRFVIRQLVPFLDFPIEKMPQIFTDTTRTTATIDPTTDSGFKRVQEDIAAVLRAGIVEPKLVLKDSDGITAADIMRDQETAGLLYLAIIEHSLFRFKGLRRAFFLAVKTLLRFTTWLRHTGKGHARLRLKESI